MGKTRHMHVVTRAYLGGFADDDGKVRCHFVKSGETKVLPTASVGVRANFYSYIRPDGTRSIAPEEAMVELEGLAVPLIRRVAGGSWPIEGEERAILAEFLALQMVRTPAWRAFHDVLRDRILDQQVEDRRELGESVWGEFTEAMRGDARRFHAMFRQVPKIGSLLGSMHWTLIRFGSDRLITSDHPVVPIELESNGGAIPTSGLANIVELRFPLSPRAALLGSWADTPEDWETRGSPQVARIVNHSVKAQAEEHWFCRPGTSPSHGFGDRRPLTVGLIHGYGEASIASSVRRRDVLQKVDQWIETQEEVKSLHIVTVSSPERSRG